MEKHVNIVLGVGLILAGVYVSGIEAAGDWPSIVGPGAFIVGVWNIVKSFG